MLDRLDGDWLGLSVTMPHKHDVLALADTADPLAQVVGAANTVLVTGSSGRRVLVAANTDVHGAAQALREARSGAAPSAAPARSAVVLGAGGTAAAALAALAELGVTDPVVCVRSQARAAGLLQAAHRMGMDVTLRRFDAAAPLIADADLVVQTAVAGAADPIAADLTALLDGRPLRPGQTLLDAIYDPWPTALAAAWSGAGGAVAPGWLMLLHQAAEQVRLMTGSAAPVDAMRAALAGALED
ncbi:shikimate 5-dehydrogenase [Litorihabitans aurantiacus]|uniref:Shikimate 5-dehydrogenase n=2 Tax=Litorihabitans aurantiacus TaxID=1930061 RepID=A0AA37UYC0_9MICO|nr:shikimate 5-dehydrogenase [Litorihabitans aurantiacus]